MGACCSGEVPQEYPLPGNQTVTIYGMPASANAMSPVLLAMDLQVGGLEVCDLMKGEQMKPEFLQMNAFHHIPTLKHDQFTMGESCAILRYLALKFKPSYYPVSDPVACGWIDFAMTSFACDVYSKWKDVVYPVLGFGKAPDDKKKALEEAKAILETWTGHFLKCKFVNGNSLSIADFKAAPFLYYTTRPGIEAQGWIASDRVKMYVEDFMAATSASSMMGSAGGFSMGEYLASKVPDAGPAKSYNKPSVAGNKELGAPSGKDVQVFGMPASCNAMSPVLLAMDAQVGGFQMCDLMSGAQMKPEFLAMNPFHHIPTMKDGTFCLGESCAILRYLALKYKPEYYPTKDAQACGRIDFAMDAFQSDVYPKWSKIVYPLMGFAKAPDDQDQANKELSEILETWTNTFLNRGKFVLGDSLSIADFKAAPFCFALIQPAIESKQKFTASGKVKQYALDFVGATKSSDMLKSAGGYSIQEFIASKA